MYLIKQYSPLEPAHLGEAAHLHPMFKPAVATPLASSFSKAQVYVVPFPWLIRNTFKAEISVHQITTAMRRKLHGESAWRVTC